jgi:hypothetical protein
MLDIFEILFQVSARNASPVLRVKQPGLSGQRCAAVMVPVFAHEKTQRGRKAPQLAREKTQRGRKALRLASSSWPTTKFEMPGTLAERARFRISRKAGGNRLSQQILKWSSRQ